MGNKPSRSLNINVAANNGMGNCVQANSIDMAGVKIVQNITQMDKGQQQTIEMGSIWFDVRGPVKSFTGRDVELKHLHDALQSEDGQVVISQITSISGLGGIGKSELARKYAHEYKEVYGGNVIWINSETQESLRISFQGLAKELKIPITEKRGEKEQKQDIKSILKDVYKYVQNRKSLFIFDNAEEYKDINEFLPSSFSLFPHNNKPYVLITSRNRGWELEEEGEIKLVQLGVLNPEEAAQFIRKVLELEDKMYDLQKTEIEQLAKQLQYFPLALQQAISYIKQRNKILELKGGKNFEITDYLKEYEEETKNLLDFQSKYRSDRYTKTTFVTWKITIEIIKQKEYGQEALSILNIMAYLAPDKVPIERFFSKLIKDEEKLWDAVELLSQYSMINVDKGVSNIHRLVQQVVRLELQNENKEEEILNNCLKLINSPNVEEDHVVSIWDYVSKYRILIDVYYFNSIYGWEKNTPLHLFVQNDCYKAIKAILTHIEQNHSNKLNKIVNAIDKNGKTPLHLAAVRCKFDLVKYLIEEKGANFNVPDKNGKTPLHSAAERGRLDLVKYLIEEKGANFNVPDKNGETPLHLAAESGELNLVKYLIEEKGADFNVPDNDGKTPLHLASIRSLFDVFAESSRLNLVKYLIEEKGANFNVPDKNGETPLHLAAESGELDLVKYLIEEKGANFNVPDNNGNTPLHLAVKRCKWDLVKYLIEEKGADFNVTDKNGKTPVHWATERCKLDLVKYLIEEKGADFNVLDNHGKTPLHWAALIGRLDLVKYLIEEKSADFNFTDNYGKTPLHWAARSGYLDSVKYLIEENGADYNLPDNNGRTLLHLAAERGRFDVLNFLIKRKGAEFNVPDNDGDSPLQWAARSGYLDLLKYLIEEKGVDFNVCDNNGETPLHLAARSGHLDFVKYLIEEKGANFNVPDNNGNTTLHWAAKNCNLQVVGYLIENTCACINIPDNDGKTPLHLVARSGHLDLVKYLIEEKGADFNVADNDGKIPLQCAFENYNLHVVRYLIEQKVIDPFTRNNHVTLLHEAVRSYVEEIMANPENIKEI